MSELEWLDGYGGQTTADLLALEGRFRTDSIVLAFEQAISQRATGSDADRLTAAETTVLAVEALERGVNSDGYLGFFTNTPEHVPYVVGSLVGIGRPDVAALTQRAIDALGVSGPLTEQSVAIAVEKEDDERDDRLNACDKEYFESAGDLANPLLAFIRSHADQVTVP